MDRLLGIFVTAIVPKPDIVPSLHKLERETSLSIRQTHPDFAAHQKTVMEIDNLLLEGPLSSVDEATLLASAIGQAV
jgi:hypothetical protein